MPRSELQNSLLFRRSLWPLASWASSQNVRPTSKDSSLARFSLPEGKTVRIITVVAQRAQRGEACREGQRVAAAVTARKLDDLHTGRPKMVEGVLSVQIVDRDQRRRVGNVLLRLLYVLGCSSRERLIPPGLADHRHLRRAYLLVEQIYPRLPLQGAVVGASLQQSCQSAMPYYNVVLKLIPEGQRLARENGTRGVLFGVNAHAWAALRTPGHLT